MKGFISRSRGLLPSWAVMTMTVVAATVLLAACVVGVTPTPPPVATPPAPTATPLPLKSLKLSPEKGYAGASFTVTGEGLTPGKAVQFQWVTWNGGFDTKVSAENVEFYEPKFVEQRVVLGNAVADAVGLARATFVAPEDFGDVHDIYALVDGQQVARGGFIILRSATMTPTQGPVGTPITITVKGLSWEPFKRTLALRYDNKYMGFVSTVTTKGTAVFQIRAAGPVGARTIQLQQSSTAQPYLNVQQSPIAYLWDNIPEREFRWVFTVTKDDGAPPPAIEFPDGRLVAAVSDAAPRTTKAAVPVALAFSAVVEPARGPILSRAALRADRLPPRAEIELIWVSARGNRLSPSGWNLAEKPLQKATTDEGGSLRATIQVPDDLGGWHSIRLVQGERLLAETPYYVERSFVDVSPKRVKSGETFTIQIKGIGWTELDNGFAATYDNAYIGYACGFNSNGDVTMTLVATGGPGTHLIDIYPYMFQGVHGKPPWSYQIPQLTALRDHPGLALGYNLPIFRLAIQVTE